MGSNRRNPAMMNIDDAKSYATEANLQKKIDRILRKGDRYIIVRNRLGRWTAIFPASNFRDGGYVAYYASHGFITI
jgi:hypothetical protein